MIRSNLIALILTIFSLSVQAQIVASARLKCKWGFIDQRGNWLIKPKFDSVSNFYNGYATIYKGKKEGLINGRGEIVIKPRYDYVDLVEENMVEFMSNDKTGYFNIGTGDIIPPLFEDGNEFSEGLAGVMNDESKWGFIDRTGKLVIPFKYDDTDWFFENDSIKVEIDDKEFFINKKDEILGEVRKETLVIYKSSLDKKIKKLKAMNPGFDSLSISSTGYRQDSIFWYRSGNKFGVADTSGKAITQPIFDYIWYFSEGVAPVQLNGKWGFIFTNGKVAINLIFEKVMNFNHGLTAAKLHGKWGFIDYTGKWIIKPILENTDGNFRDIKAKMDPIVRYSYE